MELTKEQQEDIQNRIKEFREKYLELTKKYQVDFASFPQHIQLGEGVYGTMIQTTIMDRKYAPIPSPYTDKKVIE